MCPRRVGVGFSAGEEQISVVFNACVQREQTLFVFLVVVPAETQVRCFKVYEDVRLCVAFTVVAAIQCGD